jgi:hypothetical protein
MDRRSQRRVLARAIACAGLLAAALPAAAHAQVPYDVIDWNLTESASTCCGGTNFHLSSSGGGVAQYRWIDSPAKTTVISANGCIDLGLFGSATIPAGNTSYQTLFSAGAGACFVLRGRTAIGSGSMVNHDGRLQR